MSATGDAGAVVFESPAPMMWDSPEVDGVSRVERPVGVEVGADSVSLLPDMTLLRDPAARFPVVIDPQFSYHTPSAGGSWTLVRQSHPTQSHWNLLPRDQC
ncbi:MAG: hypothetical protein GEV28_31255 [Actinophytocola sp.]|uniref:hypothetical protein n=1 Tax=Actinophytocola sp. TaxID=1872138 RepID=UPI001324DF1D|nr:hypothetical protein [Actinophytocola sp.]MPZ84623.1 hypothetical protein [Actinophytocola sp.]